MNRIAAGERNPTFLLISSICIRIVLEMMIPCLTIRLVPIENFLKRCFTFSVVFNMVITLTRGVTLRTGIFVSPLSDLEALVKTFRRSLRNIMIHLTTFPKRCKGSFPLESNSICNPRSPFLLVFLLVVISSRKLPDISLY
jgi:hypothetical protein